MLYSRHRLARPRALRDPILRNTTTHPEPRTRTSDTGAARPQGPDSHTHSHRCGAIASEVADAVVFSRGLRLRLRLRPETLAMRMASSFDGIVAIKSPPNAYPTEDLTVTLDVLPFTGCFPVSRPAGLEDPHRQPCACLRIACQNRAVVVRLNEPPPHALEPREVVWGGP